MLPNQNMMLAKRLAKVQKVGIEEVSTKGSVVTKNTYQAPLQKPGTFRVTLTATSGAGDKIFIIGDPNGLIAGLNSGITFVEPTSANVPVAALKKFLADRTLVSRINISASTSAGSLNNNPKLLSAEIDGTTNQTSIDLASAVRNDSNNDKLLTVNFAEPIVFDKNYAMSMLVPDGETITIVFSVAGVDR